MQKDRGHARELDRRLYGGTVRNPAELMEMQREGRGDAREALHRGG